MFLNNDRHENNMSPENEEAKVLKSLVRKIFGQNEDSFVLFSLESFMH